MILLAAALCAYGATPEKPTRIDLEQVPSWSAQDMAFFLHGSMSAEVVPEGVLRAFIKTYLDLFPASDLSHLGLLPDPTFGWPIGLSRANVKHLGGLSAIGINCASCHVTQITSTSTNQSSRILGVTSHFDVEKFFGSALAGTFKTADPANMKKFLAIYLNADPQALDAAWQNQEQKILATMKDDPFGAKGIGPGELQKLDNADVQQSFVADTDLAARAHSLLKLLHNMRAALHIPDQPPSSAEAAAGTPEQAPPSSGPGRNDAFGLLAAGLLRMPQPYSPIKFGLVWNLEKRPWVHWDAKHQIADRQKSPRLPGARRANARTPRRPCLRRRETTDRLDRKNPVAALSV
jgi:hypothetical protein